jgi:hypothetical protein
VDNGPRLALSGVVLDSPDAGALADFCRNLLGWEIEQDEPGWVTLRSRDGGVGLSFQTEPRYVPPMWPRGPGDRQMQVNLDIAEGDMAAAGEHAIAARSRPWPTISRKTTFASTWTPLATHPAYSCPGEAAPLSWPIRCVHPGRARATPAPSAAASGWVSHRARDSHRRVRAEPGS